MIIPTTFGAIIALATSVQAQAYPYAPKDFDNISACSGSGYALERGSFNGYAFAACDSLFKHGTPAGPANATINVPRNPGGQKDNYQLFTYMLNGDVSKMNQARCEFAFTHIEAERFNNGKGNLCISKSDHVMVTGWEFENEGRKYSLDLSKGVVEVDQTPETSKMKLDDKVHWTCEGVECPAWPRK